MNLIVAILLSLSLVGNTYSYETEEILPTPYTIVTNEVNHYAAKQITEETVTEALLKYEENRTYAVEMEEEVAAETVYTIEVASEEMTDADTTVVPEVEEIVQEEVMPVVEEISETVEVIEVPVVEALPREFAPGDLVDILDELLVVVNNVRRDAGLGALSVHHELQHLAQIQANFNAQRNILSHERGQRFNDELANIFGPQFHFLNFNGGYLRGSDLLREEIATLQVEGWLNSPGHHRNLMSNEIEFTGFGIARCPFNDNAFMIYMVSGAHN